MRAGDAPSAGFLDAGRAAGLSERQLAILAGRGYEPAQLGGILGRPEEGLHDPHLLPDAAVVVERFRGARERGERVLVFGDFDADGLTGLALLTIALRRIGLAVEVHVPSRMADGHGLSRRAIDEATELGCGVIVTVDCGTASGAEIALAAERGIDVIVTDHHHVPPALPDAVAIVNPQRVDSVYPDRGISGAGVAFGVARLLSAELGQAADPLAALELAELAAIGTVADVAPLRGENRAIVSLGLARLRSAPRPGLAAILESARLPRERVDAEALGFVIAPRLNAAGRLGDATVAARLLLTEDPAEAASLAAQLEATNLERRTLLDAALADARTAAMPDGELPVDRVVALAGPWSPGIVGLVAGKLAEQLGRPVVVASNEAEPWRVSARSSGGFDLARAFEACADLLERHGGHRDAAGCTLAPAAWDAFRARLAVLAADLPRPDPIGSLLVDVAVSAVDVDYRLFRELAMLEPTGPGNPEALVAVSGLEVVRARLANGDHTQLTVRKGLEVLDIIAFGRPDLATDIPGGARIDAVVRLVSRVFGGFESLQLELRDTALSGEAPWDAPQGRPSVLAAGAATAATPTAA
jgi:single-stranded-DNA-specific exonuclease